MNGSCYLVSFKAKGVEKVSEKNEDGSDDAALEDDDDDDDDSDNDDAKENLESQSDKEKDLEGPKKVDEQEGLD